MNGYKRVTLFAGHYGSGKTNIAVNYALMLRESEHKVMICDLDIVNPYFRTKDSSEVLNKHGIRLISSEYANTNVDVPALPAEAYAAVDDLSQHAVLDIGGDDRGALALGRYSDALLREGDCEMLFVVNMYRPLTRDAKSTLEVMHEIEAAGGIPFTAIVNNSNLGEETTPGDVLSSVEYAHSISRETGLPVKMTSVRCELCDALAGKIENIFPLRLYVRQSWLRGQE